MTAHTRRIHGEHWTMLHCETCGSERAERRDGFPAISNRECRRCHKWQLLKLGKPSGSGRWTKNKKPGRD